MQTLLSISGLEIVMVVFIYDVSIHNMKKITALGSHPLRSLFFKVGAKWGIPFINDIKITSRCAHKLIIKCVLVNVFKCVLAVFAFVMLLWVFQHEANIVTSYKPKLVIKGGGVFLT